MPREAACRGSVPNDQDKLLQDFSERIEGLGLNDLRELTGQLMAHAAPPPVTSTRKLRRPPLGELRDFVIRAELERSDPSIWRDLRVRSDLTLDVLHQVLQAAFGWTDSHLHRFSLGGDAFSRGAELFLCPFDVVEGDDEDGTPASQVRIDETLQQVGDTLFYCYDYGDNWDLTLTLEDSQPLQQGASLAACIGGRRAAPPEDCGGLRTADELAQVLTDPAEFALDEAATAVVEAVTLLEIEASIPAALARLIRRTTGTWMHDDLLNHVRLVNLNATFDLDHDELTRVLGPVTAFLDLVGEEGLPLTGAGYLKPEHVNAAAALLPGAADWIGKKNRESETMPVLWFREAMQKGGLVRKNKGRLLLTKVGSTALREPSALWRYLGKNLPVARPGTFEEDAGLLALLYAGAGVGEVFPGEKITAALAAAGWRGCSGSLHEYAAYRATDLTRVVLDNLVGDGSAALLARECLGQARR